MYEALLKNTPEYQKTAASLASPGPAALFGLPPAGRALLYAALQKDTGRILCVVTPGEAEATHFADDLKTLGLSAAVFPPRDFMLRPVEGAGREYEYRRLSVLGALAGGRLQAVCVPDEGLTQYTTPRADFCANTRSLRPGDTLPRAELTALLYGAGYTRRDQVDGPAKGRDLRLGVGRSFLGLDAGGTPVTLSADAPLSTRRAVLVYDEGKSAFTLLPGSSQELCYLGGDAVLTPQPLTGGETLRMGGAAMKFVPFCGAEFHW